MEFSVFRSLHKEIGVGPDPGAQTNSFFGKPRQKSSSRDEVPNTSELGPATRCRVALIVSGAGKC